MKSIYKIIAAIIILTTTSSCEEIVDIELRSVEPKVVIDAQITEESPCVVRLTKTQAFQNNNPYETIEDAVIELTCSDGKSETLRKDYREPGLYVSEMKGKVNATYNIRVHIQENTYQATASIPEIVYINQVYIYAITAGSKSYYSPAIRFNDPPGIKNYYYAILSVNEKVMRSIYLYDDEHRDGVENDRILFFDKEDNDDDELQTGDILRVELQNLDVGMYNFYKSLYSAAEGTNAVTNFSGGALGCFKAYNWSTETAYVSQDIIEPKKK